jgi:DNA-binding response OmpR family regulator
MLRSRAARRIARPRIDEFGQLSYRGRYALLSPIDTRLAQALIERLGEVIADSSLLQRAWPAGVKADVLRVHMCRLRQRITPLGLSVERVRSTGYVLRCSSS